MSINLVDYSSPYPKSKTKTGVGALGLAAGFASQFGIGMGKAWQSSSDAEKQNFPQWWKDMQGYKPKTATNPVSIAKPDVAPSSTDASSPATLSQKTIPVNANAYPPVNQQTSTPQPDNQYEAAWNEVNYNNQDVGIDTPDVQTTPLETEEIEQTSEIPQSVDLASN